MRRLSTFPFRILILGEPTGPIWRLVEAGFGALLLPINAARWSIPDIT